MTNAPKDPWAKTWKMHRDPKGIFYGVLDLEFTLTPINSGTNFQIYDFDYKPQSATDDPFLNTQFVRFGEALPNSPGSKLEPWIPDLEIETAYQTLIETTFASAPANTVRLIGEKVFKKNKEIILLLLIPEAIDTKTGNPRNIDLIHAVCSTQATRAHSFFFQDGTAHGNPK